MTSLKFDSLSLQIHNENSSLFDNCTPTCMWHGTKRSKEDFDLKQRNNDD